jgi:ATP-dependent Zn protease
MRRRLRATAYHEAGHAVISLLCGIPFKEVTIAAGEDSFGHVLNNRWPPSMDRKRSFDDFRSDPKRRIYFENRILIDCAGFAAQYKLTKKHDWKGAREDFQFAAELATETTYQEDERRAFLRWIRVRAKAMMEEP